MTLVCGNMISHGHGDASDRLETEVIHVWVCCGMWFLLHAVTVWCGRPGVKACRTISTHISVNSTRRCIKRICCTKDDFLENRSVCITVTRRRRRRCKSRLCSDDPRQPQQSNTDREESCSWSRHEPNIPSDNHHRVGI